MARTPPDITPLTSLAEAEAYVAMVCFKHGPPRLLGVELEWTVHHDDDPERPLDPRQLARALGQHAPTTLSPGSPHRSLSSGSLVTVEPGGQVEVSTQPSPSLPALIRDVDGDIAAVDGLLRRAGLVRRTAGSDAYRAPRRILDVPRYRAMQSLFDRTGRDGATMMCSTASLQVCLDAGEPEQLPLRWRALHDCGPALAALFANAPESAGRSTGWASDRLRATLGTCPPFTHAVASDRDPVEAWVNHAMSAPVVCVRREAGDWLPRRPMTFAEWVGDGGVPPSYDDLDYHLGTIFPPVRPRGYVEVRYLDAQPDDRWHHPVVVLDALLSDPEVTGRAIEVAGACSGRWLDAARDGLDDPVLRGVARSLVELAADHLDPDLPAPVAGDVLDTLDRRTEHRPTADRRSRPGQARSQPA